MGKKIIVKKILSGVLAATLILSLLVLSRPAETRADQKIPDSWQTYVSADYTGLALNTNGSWYYLSKGKVKTSYSNLVYYEGAWYYVHQGKIDWSYSTLAQVNGKGDWYCVHNGTIDWGYTGLELYNGVWYFIQNGILNWKFSGLWYQNGGWWYVKKGWIDWSYSNLVEYYGTWYYVHNGAIDWTCTTLSQVNGTGDWYFVRKGVLDWSYTGLFQYYKTWYYVNNGRVDFSFSGVCKYQGKWYLIKKGQKNTSYTGLAMAPDGNWYYFEKGEVNTKHTGLGEYDDEWYYVKNGKLDWSYSGTLYNKKNGECYDFKKGHLEGVWWDVRSSYELVNKFRTTKKNQWYWKSGNKKKQSVAGLSKLKKSTALEKVARKRAKEQWIQYYDKNKKTHTRPNGSSWKTAYPSGTNPVGENLAWEFFSANNVLTYWAETDAKYEGQKERRLLLSSDATKVGIACYEKDGFTCWAICLGK